MPTDSFSLIATAHAATGATGEHMDVLSLVTSSGLIVQSVLYMLVLSSVACWGIVFHKFRQIREARRQSAEFVRVFWETKNLTTIYEVVDELARSPVAQVFRAGYREVVRINKDRQDDAAGVRVDSVERAMKRATTEQLTELERSLTFLATTASAAPFIGLFGTVIGIIRSFESMAATGSGGFAVVAAGISEALIATAGGLFVGVVSIFAYNAFMVRIANLSGQWRDWTDELLVRIDAAQGRDGRRDPSGVQPA